MPGKSAALLLREDLPNCINQPLGKTAATKKTMLVARLAVRNKGNKPASEVMGTTAGTITIAVMALVAMGEEHVRKAASILTTREDHSRAGAEASTTCSHSISQSIASQSYVHVHPRGHGSAK